jgi:hypothetical protein
LACSGVAPAISAASTVRAGWWSFQRAVLRPPSSGSGRVCLGASECSVPGASCVSWSMRLGGAGVGREEGQATDAPARPCWSQQSERKGRHEGALGAVRIEQEIGLPERYRAAPVGLGLGVAIKLLARITPDRCRPRCRCHPICTSSPSRRASACLWRSSRSWSSRHATRLAASAIEEHFECLPSRSPSSTCMRPRGLGHVHQGRAPRPPSWRRSQL